MNKTLEITTTIGCVNRCSFCPQDRLIEAYKGEECLSFRDFRVMLKRVPKTIQIDFTGFCEPFLNTDASFMMRHAIEKGYKTVLLTTLTGFTEKDADVLKGLKFEQVLIHEFSFNNIDKEVRMLEQSLGQEIKRFRLTSEFQWSRAGNVWDRESKKGTFECGWTGKEFSRNVLLPNGDVYGCCMDYSLKHRIGNLFKTNYTDLDRQSLVNLSNEEDSDCICRKCEMIKII